MLNQAISVYGEEGSDGTQTIDQGAYFIVAKVCENF